MLLYLLSESYKMCGVSEVMESKTGRILWGKKRGKCTLEGYLNPTIKVSREYSCFIA